MGQTIKNLKSSSDKEDKSDTISETSDIFQFPKINESNIPMKNRIPTVFKWNFDAKSVKLSGSFNQWTKMIPLVKSGDEHMAIIELPLGSHYYRFLVDDEWCVDEMQPSYIINNHRCNIIDVTDSDLDVFDALETDYLHQNKPSVVSKFNSIRPPPNYYYNPLFEKEGPPVESIPSAILNTSTMESNDSLPETSFSENASLTHLKVLRFHDDVVATSVTHRFRTKMVTTIFYQKKC